MKAIKQLDGWENMTISQLASIIEELAVRNSSRVGLTLTILSYCDEVEADTTIRISAHQRATADEDWQDLSPPVQGYAFEAFPILLHHLAPNDFELPIPMDRRNAPWVIGVKKEKDGGS